MESVRMVRKVFLLVASPILLMLALYYSLAINMRYTLGAWPSSIGERGFPPLLLAHAELTQVAYALVLLSAVFIAPATWVISLAVPRWRRFAPYPAEFFLLFIFAVILMQFAAPESFIYWWRD